VIKEDPLKPNTFIVRYSKRHPITRKVVGLARKGIRTKAEANKVYRQLVIEVEDKQRRVMTPTWKEMVIRFVGVSREREMSEKTIENYRLCLEAHTSDWNDRLVDSITSQEIRDLIRHRVGHRSQSHQKNVLKFIRAVFNLSVEVGVLARNPTPLMKFRIGDKIMGVLTEVQVCMLLEQAKLMECEWYWHWSMALYTGMRTGELYALTWDKVNLDERKILVDCAWNSKDGFKSTKSGDDRIIEIAPNLQLILKQLKLMNHDSVFVLPRVDKWDKGEQARELRMFLTGLGLTSVRFHDLRATWATILLGKGVAPIKVMKMGGWKDLKTMQRYSRMAGIDIKGITDGLDLHNPSFETAKVVQIQPKL